MRADDGDPAEVELRKAGKLECEEAAFLQRAEGVEVEPRARDEVGDEPSGNLRRELKRSRQRVEVLREALDAQIEQRRRCEAAILGARLGENGRRLL